ncbi:MAG: hypothetical protein U9R02_09610, partial [Thermodesulfobacteriota bacterium]|nr:hypothetical protein [Thermodesulfobacteriota bacterium]
NKVTRSRFNGLQFTVREPYILEEMLPGRKYDLTEAICEGVKETGQVKKKKAFCLRKNYGSDSSSQSC